MYTEEALKAMSKAELLAAYKAATGSESSRFASRGAAIKAVLKVQGGGKVSVKKKAGAAAPAPKKAKVKKVKAKVEPKVKVSKPRTVRGSAGEAKGRPRGDYVVHLTEEKAKSKPHVASARMQFIERLRNMPGKKELLSEAERAMKMDLRGVVQKLKDKHWITVTPVA